MHKNVYLLSLGCTKNLVDSEKLNILLTNNGFNFVDNSNEADILIINTCGFIEDAKKESIESILDLIAVKKNPDVKIFVIGCLAERYKNDLKKEFPEVDYFFGINSQEKILQTLSCFYSLNAPYESGYKSIAPNHVGFLKIAEGCSNKCSYCSIPGIRGDFHSFPKEEIFKDLSHLLRRGAKEINVIAQDTTRYGKDCYKDYFLFHLLSDISKYKEIKWLRLLYTHPAHLDDNIIGLINSSDKICNYLDLPLQHVNDRILTEMNRGVSKSDILKLIDKIRRYPIALRTTFIVGFPGETDKEFKELLKFIKDVRFEKLGVFLYSNEEDTPAYNFKNQIPQDVKQARYKELMKIQQKISMQNNQALLDKEVDVIIDEVLEEDNNYFVGRTQWDAPDVDGNIFVKKVDGVNVGDIVKVKVVDTWEYDLVGELI